MKTYAMVAAATLLAGQWSGSQPRTLVVLQSAIQTNAPNTTSMAARQPATPISSDKPTFFILAEFTQSLNARKLKPGDTVKAEVTQDVLSHGRIVIPVESKLVGHVTEVKSHRVDDPGSRLGIVFDRVLLKHRVAVDFRGVLHALSAPALRRSRVDEPDPMLAPGLPGMNRSMPVGSSSIGGSPNSNIGGSMGTAGSSPINPAGPPPSISNGLPMGTVPTAGAGDSARSPNHGGPSPAMVGDQRSMSVGMPMGVFGLNGLSLTPEGTSSTPGPVILSRRDDVKLESGTQILLKITDATVKQP